MDMISIGKFKEFLLEILFPQICLGCSEIIQKESDKKVLICKICVAEFRFIENRIYIQNGVSLLVLSSYKNHVIRSLIHKLKYQRLTKVITPIEKLINSFLQTSLGLELYRYDGIVPIPLHSKREKERGFNQAKLIAHALSSMTNTPLIDCLERTVDTPHQTNIKKHTKRIENMSGVFQIKSNAQIKNLDLLLVDDVYTSGATTLEAVKTLNHESVSKVDIFVLAKS